MIANLHSATCFLNSFLREWPEHRIVAMDDGDRVEIPLSETNVLKIPLKRASILGRHRYHGRFFVNGIEISFEKMVDAIASLVAARLGTSATQVDQFRTRVFSSRDNIALTIEERGPELRDLGKTPLTFERAEQSLWIGHNFHPTPKSRDEFTNEDMRLYSPELAGRFALEWFMADPEILYRNASRTFGDRSWTDEVAALELGPDAERLRRELSRKGFVAFPMHPWQFNVLAEKSPVADALRSGRLVRLGPSTSKWSATSSLRSLYRESAPCMLKFSMTLKLTNSIRHMLTREVDRGLQLHDVLATETGSRFRAEHPAFHVLAEPAYLCLKDRDGNPLDETLVMERENPFVTGKTEDRIVLATLTQDALADGPNPLGSLLRRTSRDRKASELAKDWFSAFLEVAVKPMFRAQAHYGFLLGAHQQNLILELRDGMPVGAFFRDCQGTGYSEIGFAHFSKDVPSIVRENGNVLTRSAGNALFTYYLVLNSTFNVITALTEATEGDLDEADLLAELRSCIERLRAENPVDPSCLDSLLNDDNLPHKGNFLCAFRGINENTTTDPLAIYTPVPNPLKRISQTRTLPC